MTGVHDLGLFVVAGLLLKDGRWSDARRVQILFAAGVVSLGIGLLWAMQFPIIKLLWTSTYVLVSCGISAILLAIFHLLTDVLGWRRWAQPFVWIGMNAITIYLVGNIVNFRKLADRFVGGDVAIAMGRHGELLRSVVALGLVLTLAWYLHRLQTGWRGIAVQFSAFCGRWSHQW